MHKPKDGTQGLAVPGALAGLLALAMIVAGCAGTGDGLGDDPDNEPPEAQLSVNKDVTWTNERVQFDGSQSSDEDGNITEWRFDFGDGTQVTVTEEDQADSVDHQYQHGGEFVATLTVRDDGGDQVGEKVDTDTVDLAVNERQEIVAQVIYAAPTNESETATYTTPVGVYEGVDRFELEVTAASSIPAGASEIDVRLVDPGGETVEEGTVTVNAGENETLNLDGIITEAGTYEVIVEAESGGATVHGEFRTYYDADFPL